MHRDITRHGMSGRFGTPSALGNLAVAFGATAFVASCMDLGYDVPLAEDFDDAGVEGGPADSGPPTDGSSPMDAGDTGGPACEEGVTSPSADGPQLAFVPTLQVDATDLEIRVGDVLTVTNAGGMTHTMTAGSPGALLPESLGGFDSGAIPVGAQWAYRFCSPRALAWFCSTHPAQMNGYRLTVVE